MKNLKESAYDKSVWQQVAVKIKHADADRRNETKDLMNKIKSTIERNNQANCTPQR